MLSPYKSKGGVRRLFNALRYSLSGLGYACKHEAAFRQELFMALVLLPCALWLGETVIETLLLIGVLVWVLVVELLNSALEAVADAVTLEQHPLIAQAKDLGSAAVFLSIVLAVTTWILILWK